MAKFFLTNDISLYQKTRNLIQKTPFKISFEYGCENSYILATHKINISNINAFQTANLDYIVATGTAIYKESLSLDKAYEDFSNNIGSIRINTIGQYAFCIKKNDVITIFGDAFGLYDIYYYNFDGIYYISNSLYDMARILKDKISLDEFNVLEFSAECSILGNGTFFNEIKRLQGDEYISIINNVAQIIYDKSLKLRDGIKRDFEDLVQKAAETLSHKAEVTSKVLGSPDIFMTGGLDSRLVLASYLSCGVKPNLVFGVSNTPIAGPKEEDSMLVKLLADTFGLSCSLDNWDTTNVGDNWDEYLDLYGFTYSCWGGCKDIFDSFGNPKNSYLNTGKFGETYRNLDGITEKNKIISFNELLNHFLYKHANQTCVVSEKIPGYKEHIKRKLLNIAKKYEIDINNLKTEDYFYFQLAYRRISDTRELNLVNMMRYSTILLAENGMDEFMHVNTQFMDDTKYMLHIIYKLYPDILNVPLFSRLRMRKFDKKNMILLNAFDSTRSKPELLIKRLYQKFGYGLNPLRNIYVKIRDSFVKPLPIANDFSSKEQICIENKWSNILNYDVSFTWTDTQIIHIMNLKSLNNILNG